MLYQNRIKFGILKNNFVYQNSILNSLGGGGGYGGGGGGGFNNGGGYGGGQDWNSALNQLRGGGLIFKNILESRILASRS